MESLPSAPPQLPAPVVKQKRPRTKFSRQPKPASALDFRHPLDDPKVARSDVTKGTVWNKHKERATAIKDWRPDRSDMEDKLIRSIAEERAAKAMWAKLSDKQRESIRQYTGGSYQGMNKLARGKGVDSVWDKPLYSERVYDVEDAFQVAGTKATVPVDTKLFRHTKYSSGYPPEILNVKPGHTLTDFGIGSFSISSSSTTFFGGGSASVSYEVLAPKGTRGMYVQQYSHHPGEKELILPRGSVLLVHEVEWIGTDAVKIVAEVMK